jgi:uncharacterized protein (TIGR03000 family)
MYKQYLSALATLAAAAAFALTPGVAMAQHHGGGHTGGVHVGGAHVSGFHAGGGHAGSFHAAPGFSGAAVHHGGAFHGTTAHHAGGFGGVAVHHGGFHGYRYGGFHDYHHGGFYGRRYGYGGWGYPYYGGLGFVYPGYSDYVYSPTYNYYSYGAYDAYPYDTYGYDTYPYDSDTYMAPAYGDLTPPSFDAGAYAPPAAAADTVAHIQVIVPPDAKVWFNGSLTQATGSDREFASPPLVPGQDYNYDITAQWTEGGQEVTQTRHVGVRAGAGVVVDFTRPGPGQ